MKKNRIKSVLTLIATVLIGMLVLVGCKLAPKTFTLTYTVTDGGHIDGSSVQTVAAGADGEAVTAVADTGYRFVKWSDGVTSAERKETSVKNDVELTAHFEKDENRYFTIKYAATEGGHVEGELEQTVVRHGDAKPVIAVPEAGFKFVSWSDGIETAERTDEYVRKSKTITAEFDVAIPLELNYTVSEGGRFVGMDPSLSTFTQYLSWKKDGEPVTVCADECYEFVEWSDGVKNLKRIDKCVQSDLSVSAKFKRVYNVVEYTSGYGGKISGETTQKVDVGKESKEVTAVPDDGFVFVGWSDGVKDATRNDLPRENMRVTAEFDWAVRFEYKVHNPECGRIEGETIQTIQQSTYSSPVMAVPNDGYAFAGWSDFSLDPSRSDMLPCDFGMKNSDTFIAIFQRLDKTFDYDYCGATENTSERSVNVSFDDPRAAQFALPQKDGYTFGGWYADSEYKLRVTDETGRLMLGRYTPTLDTDTLYARWIVPDDDSIVYKILMVVVEDIDAEIYFSYYDDTIVIDYKMNLFERIVCHRIVDGMSHYLNKWFDGKVRFEVDMYYTLDVVGKEGFESTSYKDMNIYPGYIREIHDMLGKYGSMLSMVNLNDYDGKITAGSGTATIGQGSVYLEDMVYDIKLNGLFFYELFDDEFYELSSRWLHCIKTCIHEFTHTVESQYRFGTIAEYHDIYYYYFPSNGDLLLCFEATRLYLLCEAEVDGIKVGIPPSFWTEGGNKKM